MLSALQQTELGRDTKLIITQTGSKQTLVSMRVHFAGLALASRTWADLVERNRKQDEERGHFPAEGPYRLKVVLSEHLSADPALVANVFSQAIFDPNVLDAQPITVVADILLEAHAHGLHPNLMDAYMQKLRTVKWEWGDDCQALSDALGKLLQTLDPESDGPLTTLLADKVSGIYKEQQTWEEGSSQLALAVALPAVLQHTVVAEHIGSSVFMSSTATKLLRDKFEPQTSKEARALLRCDSWEAKDKAYSFLAHRYQDLDAVLVDQRQLGELVSTFRGNNSAGMLMSFFVHGRGVLRGNRVDAWEVIVKRLSGSDKRRRRSFKYPITTLDRAFPLQEQSAADLRVLLTFATMAHACSKDVSTLFDALIDCREQLETSERAAADRSKKKARRLR